MTKPKITGVIVIWVVACVLTVTGALDPAHAALLATCGTAAVFVRFDQPASLPLLPSLPLPKHAGAHSDLSGLAWGMFDIDDAVSDRPVARIRALAPDLQDEIDSCPHPSVGRVKRWLHTIEQTQGASNAAH